MKYLPDGIEDLTKICVNGINGEKLPLYIWSEKKEKLIRMRFRAISYKVKTSDWECSNPMVVLSDKEKILSNFGAIEKEGESIENSLKYNLL